MFVRWACRNPVNINERKAIEKGLRDGLTYTEIGKLIDREKTTVRREANRLGSFQNYNAEKAQEHFERLQKEKPAKISATLLKNNANKKRKEESVLPKSP